MRIFIAGAGAVGTHLARLFVESEHEVILMDDDEQKLRQMEQLDIMTYRGAMTSLETLKEAQVHSCDLFIAVPPFPDMSVLACVLAKKLGAKTTIARINTSEYLTEENRDFFRQLGVDVLIYPERLGSSEAVQSLKRVGIRQLFEVSNGRLVVAVIKIRNTAPLCDTVFATFDAERKGKYNIVAIYRNGETIIPHGDDALQHNDLAYFVTTREYLPFVLEDCGKEQYTIENVMIIGGSQIGGRIAKELEGEYNVKLIELSRERSNKLANSLEQTMIINGDGRDLQLLKDEGIQKMQAFIAVTGNSEVNILACQLAKKLGVNKTVAEVENLDYIPIAEEIGIGTIINKKLIAASYIFRYTMNAKVSYVKYLTSSNAEMLELTAQPNSKITLSPIMNLNLPSDVNIGGIVRNGEAIIVSGSTQVQAGDNVLIFRERGERFDSTMPTSVPKIEKLFI